MQQETHWGVAEQQSTSAFDLADAAVQRGYWMVHSSTANCAAAVAGTVIAGYNFDTTYTDMPGGTYRIQISALGNNTIKIIGEGRDSLKKQVRAISATYMNKTVYSPLMAQGMLSYGKGLDVYWGSIMSQGNIHVPPAAQHRRHELVGELPIRAAAAGARLRFIARLRGRHQYAQRVRLQEQQPGRHLGPAHGLQFHGQP
jgi:hypothetical protein